MKRNELFAAIEEATDASLADYAARNPEDAAAILDERAEANEALAKEGVTLTFEAIRRDTSNLATTLRGLAVELRKSVAQSEAA
jgi:hypothetical protein